MFGPSDERRVRAVVKELGASLNTRSGDSDALRRRRVASALERLTVASPSLLAPELGLVEGREAILELLESAAGMSLEVGIEQSDVRIARDGAEATLLIALSAETPGERRRQQRTLTVELRRRDGSFLVDRVNASAASREQPEARP
jgi:hypothetical protein